MYRNSLLKDKKMNYLLILKMALPSPVTKQQMKTYGNLSVDDVKYKGKAEFDSLTLFL